MSLANGQGIDGRENDAVRVVVWRDALFRNRVSVVEPGIAVNFLRPDVVSHDEEAARETFLKAHVEAFIVRTASGIVEFYDSGAAAAGSDGKLRKLSEQLSNCRGGTVLGRRKAGERVRVGGAKG